VPVHRASFAPFVEHMGLRTAFDVVRCFSWMSLVFVMSCDSSTPVEVHVAPANSTTAAPVTSAAAPRRPTLQHILARTEERCEMFSIDGDQVSPSERTPCPEDLDIGERIRITGKTCLREGKPERRKPVVCPFRLLLRDQRDAGPDGAP
jgi:hypothetical protein